MYETGSDGGSGSNDTIIQCVSEINNFTSRLNSLETNNRIIKESQKMVTNFCKLFVNEEANEQVTAIVFDFIAGITNELRLYKHIDIREELKKFIDASDTLKQQIQLQSPASNIQPPTPIPVQAPAPAPAPITVQAPVPTPVQTPTLIPTPIDQGKHGDYVFVTLPMRTPTFAPAPPPQDVIATGKYFKAEDKYFSSDDYTEDNLYTFDDGDDEPQWRFTHISEKNKRDFRPRLQPDLDAKFSTYPTYPVSDGRIVNNHKLTPLDMADDETFSTEKYLAKKMMGVEPQPAEIPKVVRGAFNVNKTQGGYEIPPPGSKYIPRDGKYATAVGESIAAAAELKLVNGV